MLLLFVAHVKELMWQLMACAVMRSVTTGGATTSSTSSFWRKKTGTKCYSGPGATCITNTRAGSTSTGTITEIQEPSPETSIDISLPVVLGPMRGPPPRKTNISHWSDSALGRLPSGFGAVVKSLREVIAALRRNNIPHAVASMKEAYLTHIRLSFLP